MVRRLPESRQLNEFELFKKSKEKKANKLSDDIKNQLDFLDFEQVEDGVWKKNILTRQKDPVLNLRVEYNGKNWTYNLTYYGWFKKYLNQAISGDKQLSSLLDMNEIRKTSDLSKAVKLCDDLVYTLKQDVLKDESFRPRRRLSRRFNESKISDDGIRMFDRSCC